MFSRQLLVTRPVAQHLEEDLKGSSRRQKWKGSHKPMQSDLTALETSQRRQGSPADRQAAVGIFTTFPQQQTWGRISTEPMHSAWQSREGMSQKKPRESWKYQVSYCLLSPWHKANTSLQNISFPRFLLFLSFLLNSAQQNNWFHVVWQKHAS